jgi:AraC-like DNA-binding protein
MLELFFSASGAGACIVLMMLILKDFYHSIAARAFLVLIFGAFVHLCYRWLPEHLVVYAFMVSSSTPAFFWISSRLIFQEGRSLPIIGLFIALYSFITPAVATLLGLNIDTSPSWLVLVTKTIPQWFEYALVIMGLVALLRGRADDMVESRRRLRWAIMGGAGLSLGWSIFSFNFKFGSAASRVLAIDISLLIIIWFLFKGRTDIWVAKRRSKRKQHPSYTVVESVVKQARREYPIVADTESATTAIRSATSKKEVDRPEGVESVSNSEVVVDQATFDVVEEIRESEVLVSLKLLMNDGFYRRESLALKHLAKEMALPEYRVRAVINKELGYRNFNEFINEYRIKEAAERLLNEPDTPISNIALDIGYRTLSSFNRAFRKEKQTTPTAYREQK